MNPQEPLEVEVAPSHLLHLHLTIEEIGVMNAVSHLRFEDALRLVARATAQGAGIHSVVSPNEIVCGVDSDAESVGCSSTVSTSLPELFDPNGSGDNHSAADTSLPELIPRRFIDSDDSASDCSSDLADQSWSSDLPNYFYTFTPRIEQLPPVISTLCNPNCSCDSTDPQRTDESVEQID